MHRRTIRPEFSSQMIRVIMTAFALCASLLAQRTWIVDMDQRNGFDFADIPAAVTAASPGDTIFVRLASGSYTSPVIQKSLSLLGESTSVSLRGVTVSNTAKGSRVVIANLAVDATVSSCNGAVIFSNSGPVILFGKFVSVTSSRNVSFSDYFLTSFLIANSTVTLSRCAAMPLTFSSQPQPGITMTNSRLFLVDSSASGGAKSQAGLNCGGSASAAIVGSGEVWMSGPKSSVYGGRACGGWMCSCWVQAAAVSGPTLYRDHSSLMDPATGQSMTIPSVATSGVAYGTDQTIEVHAPAGALSALFASLPSDPLPFAGSLLWLDLNVNILVSIGVIPATGTLTRTEKIAAPFPRGMALVWQAAVLETSGELHFSLPSTSVAY